MQSATHIWNFHNDTHAMIVCNVSNPPTQFKIRFCIMIEWLIQKGYKSVSCRASHIYKLKWQWYLNHYKLDNESQSLRKVYMIFLKCIIFDMQMIVYVKMIIVRKAVMYTTKVYFKSLASNFSFQLWVIEWKIWISISLRNMVLFDMNYFLVH